MAEVELSAHNRISAGIFTCVHRITEDRVRKVSRTDEADDIQAVHNEAAIYRLLGRHERIAKCTSAELTSDYVDLEWAKNGNLEDYVRKYRSSIAPRLLFRFGYQIIEAVRYIHDQNIVHSDLALRQYLVYDDSDARLSNFAASGYDGQEALGMENATHYMPRGPDQPNTPHSDIFALGSTLYELMMGRAPYEDKTDDKILSLFQQGKSPCTNDIPCGDVILRCWKGEFRLADDVLLAYKNSPEVQSQRFS